MSAGEIIKALEAERRRQGLTYYAVAKAAGASPIAVERVLTGARVPTLPTLIGIAVALGQSVVLSPGRTKSR